MPNSSSSSRRRFLKKSAGLTGGLATLGTSLYAQDRTTEFPTQGELLVLNTPLPEGGYYPLQSLDFESSQAGNFRLVDSFGQIYFEQPLEKQLSCRIGGALGYQRAELIGEQGELLDYLTFRVDARTRLEENTGVYQKLLDTLHWTMVRNYGNSSTVRLDGKFYEHFVRWLRDHVHTLKGMKYFYPYLKSGIDLYANYQREDGMIWDNLMPRARQKNWWDKRFTYGNFIKHIDEGRYELKRIPVENDVEYLFIEGIYYTWKATGDTPWMIPLLDNALKALDYTLHSPYRWSKKYQLLKRGFTIDTWDFQSNEDTEISGGDIMRVELDKTRFGVMFGDNTGMAAACQYLGEMLEAAEREEEAQRVRKIGKDLQERIDALAWKGTHYQHHVPENPEIKRDFGSTDQSRQVSLSNAYSLNRKISHEQAVAIIQSYQRIKKEMPASSPGEWYTIYPPFEKGFGKDDSSREWDYMNGGVTPIVAGELAHGAFEHGYEGYGTDILKRIAELAKKSDDYLECVYRGKMPEAPERTFQPIDLRSHFNTAYPNPEATSHGETFASHDRFLDIPFQILSSPSNALALASGKSVNVAVPDKASSLYFLHTCTSDQVVLYGDITLHYRDGSKHLDYIDETKCKHWWSNEVAKPSKPTHPNCQRAWRSDDDSYTAVAFYVYGLNNPYPSKAIDRLELKAAENEAVWYISALTTSDHPVYFAPSMYSYGIPDNWGAAALVYALLEGMAGAKDDSVIFKQARLSPRWAIDPAIRKVNTTVRYEASEGYLSYEYVYDPANDTLTIDFTGNAEKITLEVLLPEGKKPKNSSLNGTPVTAILEQIEDSAYAVYSINQPGVYQLRIALSA